MRDIPPAAEIAMHSILAAMLACLGTLALLPQFTWEAEWVVVSVPVALVVAIIGTWPRPRLATYAASAPSAIVAAALTAGWWSVTYPSTLQSGVDGFDGVFYRILLFGTLVALPVALAFTDSRQELRPMVLRAATAMALTAAIVSVIAWRVPADEDIWPAWVAVIPAGVALAAALPRVRPATFLTAAIGSLLVTALLAGRDLISDEYCDCNAEHHYRLGIDSAGEPAAWTILVVWLVLVIATNGHRLRSARGSSA